MAINWPPTSGVVFLSFAIKIIKRIPLFLIMRIINDERKQTWTISAKKGPREPNFKALKEHFLGSLQRTNLTYTSRRERTFSIGRNYFDFVNKN